MLYQYKTKSLNLAVRRNIERFPDEFCFRLNEQELESLRFQIETSNDKDKEKSTREGRRYLPYVFTKQGIAKLAGVLKSETAITISINIIKAFVEMRKLLNNNEQVFERLSTLKYKQIENEKNFNKVFNLLQGEENIKQKIFFEGQILDSYSLIINIIKKTKRKKTIIDNYIDDSNLKMLTKKNKGAQVVILTSNKSNIQNLDIKKFNKEYPILKIAKTNKFHDRFIIIDGKELYHLGTSIKDLGKKCFAIIKLENEEMLEMLKKII